MKTRIVLSVKCPTLRVRRALRSVLTPDNEGAPAGLGLSMTGHKEVVRVELESSSPAVACSTTLALLRDIRLFEQVWLLSRANDGWHRGQETQ